MPSKMFRMSIAKVTESVTSERHGSMKCWITLLETVEELTTRAINFFLLIPDVDKMSSKRFKIASYNLFKFLLDFELSESTLANPTEEWLGAEGWLMINSDWLE